MLLAQLCTELVIAKIAVLEGVWVVEYCLSLDFNPRDVKVRDQLESR